MELKFGKKGIMFTFLAIVIASVLAIIFSSNQANLLDSKVDTTKMKILASNEQITSVIDYAHASLRSSSYKALQEMIDEIYITGSYYSGLEDINETFKELVMNGTINNVEHETMENFTMPLYMKKVENASREYFSNDLKINVSNVWIEQTLPYSVFVHINLSLRLNNTDYIWNITRSETVSVSIEGLKDPIYFFNMPYNNTFKKTKTFIREFNATTFELFVNNSEYIVTPQKNVTGQGDLPMSFFARLTNNPQDNFDYDLNLLSIVSPYRLNQSGMAYIDQPTNVSYIDYMFDLELNNHDCNAMLRKVKNITNSPAVDRMNLRTVFFKNSSRVELEQGNIC